MTNCCSIWILGDQLLDLHPAIEYAESRCGKGNCVIVIVESKALLQRFPYHRKKLVLILSAMRHYAVQLEARGFQVDYVQAVSTLRGLREHLHRFQSTTLITMKASSYSGRKLQSMLGKRLGISKIKILENTQFLLGRYNPIPKPEPMKRYVMEYFYRAMRKHFNLLMDGEKPAGGAWNFDRENRKPLPKDIRAPDVPQFEPDEITQDVISEIRQMKNGFGEAEPFTLAVTHMDAEQAFEDFLHRRLANFGAYEDAMAKESATLFHSMISPYINLGLLDPLDLARRVESAYRNSDVPINSAEGFIRQVIGWREYIYWQYHRMMPDMVEENFWKAARPLPGMFWDGKTRMHCMQTVFERVRNEGYLHHIERLMLICNFGMLTGLDPVGLNDWFMCTFIDAYEWVMVPNVIGMGLHADGGLTATKPYIASANYIHKMSDYCGACEYERTQRSGPAACPFNTLYWNFLLENEHTLRKNPRMGRNVLGLRHLDAAERERVRSGARALFERLDSLGYL